MDRGGFEAALRLRADCNFGFCLFFLFLHFLPSSFTFLPSSFTFLPSSSTSSLLPLPHLPPNNDLSETVEPVDICECCLTQVAENRRSSSPKRSIRQILAARSMPIIDALQRISLALINISTFMFNFYSTQSPWLFMFKKRNAKRSWKTFARIFRSKRMIWMFSILQCRL